MLRLLKGAILCAILSATAVAQQSPSDAPATKEDIQEYLNVVHSTEMMTQMTDAMSKPLHKMVHDQYMKDKNRLPPNFEAQANSNMDVMLKNMPFDEMMQAMIPVYQKHFTKGDINYLLAFYSSPTGQKLLREMPAIAAEAMESSMPIMQKYMETVKQRMQDQIADALKQSEKRPD